LTQDFDEADQLAIIAFADPNECIMHLSRAVQGPFDLMGQVALGPGNESDPRCCELYMDPEVGVAQYYNRTSANWLTISFIRSRHVSGCGPLSHRSVMHYAA
jgi:hypothetical protein